MSSESFDVLVTELLQEYGSKLGIDGSSAVLAWDQPVAQTIEAWSKERYMSYLPSIEVLNIGSDRKWPYAEEKFTHIFAATPLKDRDDLQLLRWIQYTLKYKGVAVLIILESDQMQAAEVSDFLERASFERGRVRVLDRKLTSPQDTNVKAVLAMKWDMLSA